ncbi:hypothetical protein NDU88_003356 [Pleurodeles waltl]|uniref:Uncharacterized protein n=1 Tax=Pleurodeles waltl TaxID=8319 RepID=A0AAV7W4R9_PLEWA|nr:hypothetical protein NDU88_003356 [Pleurodeles waltl]
MSPPMTSCGPVDAGNACPYQGTSVQQQQCGAVGGLELCIAACGLWTMPRVTEVCQLWARWRSRLRFAGPHVLLTVGAAHRRESLLVTLHAPP